jgi:hypothetical protein
VSSLLPSDVCLAVLFSLPGYVHSPSPPNYPLTPDFTLQVPLSSPLSQVYAFMALGEIFLSQLLAHYILVAMLILIPRRYWLFISKSIALDTMLSI